MHIKGAHYKIYVNTFFKNYKSYCKIKSVDGFNCESSSASSANFQTIGKNHTIRFSFMIQVGIVSAKPYNDHLAQNF